MRQKRHLTILQINDTHGYLEPHPELFWHGDRAEFRSSGGYARLLTVFNRARQEADVPVFAFDNGDSLHGTYHAVHSQGESLVKPLNLLGLDAWTVHWDFAYGPLRLRGIAERLNHPLLACNCYQIRNNELAYPASTVIERGGLRVGVVGIAATIIDKTMPEHFSTGLRFTLGNEELSGHIRTLRELEQVDLVVVLSHLGFPQDIKLASEIAGIDVLLSGHTHNRMDAPVFVHGAAIIQSGCHGSFVGRLDIELTDKHVTGLRHRLIAVDASIPADPEMHLAVEEIVGPHRLKLSAVVGHTETALHRNTFLESTMDNLLLQAIAEFSNTRIAFSNGWRYGAPIPPGPVTENDLWNIVPPNPPVSMAELSGRELWEMMEENLEHVLAADPYRQMGGYVKRCLGVNLYIKFENPFGSRIQQFFINGETLEDDRQYTVSFITSQGVPRKYGSNRRDMPLSTMDALRSYFRNHPVVNAEPRDSMVAV